MTSPSPAVADKGRSARTAVAPFGRSRWSGERGDIASSMIILPVVIAAISLCIQGALVLHGTNVANAAAQDGLRAAQLDGANEGNGKVAAQNTLALFDGIEAAKVTVTKNDDTVTVRIEGEIAVPLDGVFNSFNVSATGPVERFYLESEPLLTTGVEFSPIDAERHGLVNEICEPGTARERALVLAETINANSPVAAQLALQAVDRIVAADDDDAWAISREYRDKVMASDDSKEGVNSSKERRDVTIGLGLGLARRMMDSNF